MQNTRLKSAQSSSVCNDFNRTILWSTRRKYRVQICVFIYIFMRFCKLMITFYETIAFAKIAPLIEMVFFWFWSVDRASTHSVNQKTPTTHLVDSVAAEITR